MWIPQPVAPIIVFLFAACQSNDAAPTVHADTIGVADTLRQKLRVFEEGINALDVDRQLSLFSPDPDMTWAGDGQLVLMQRDSLGALYRNVYRGYRKMTFAWDTMRIAVLAPNAGVVTAGGHFTVTDTAGKSLSQLVVGTYVFARRNGTWQLIHGHASHKLTQ